VCLSLFEEVTVAKKSLEQVALACQGRKAMHDNTLECIDQHVQNNVLQINQDPSQLMSSRPVDDPFERIMFLTSAGEPSVVCQNRSLCLALSWRLYFLLESLEKKNMKATAD